MAKHEFARQLAQQYDYAGAIKQAELALKAGYHDTDFIIELAHWYAELIELDKAINLLDNIVKDNPDHIVIKQRLAHYHMRSFNFKQSIGYVDQVSILSLSKFNQYWQELASQYAQLLIYCKHHTMSNLYEISSFFTKIKQSFVDSVYWHRYAVGSPYNKYPAYIETGDLETGYYYYERRQFNIHYNSLLNQFKYWKGESLADKAILILSEQGLGDELLFANCFTDISQLANRCIVICDPRLHKLFQQSHPTIEFISCKQDASLAQLERPVADYVILSGSLFYHFRKTKQSFLIEPAIKLDEVRVKYYKDYLDELSTLPKVGIAWRSRLNRDKHSPRLGIQYLQLKDLAPIVKNKAFYFVNLQYELDQTEIQKLKNKFNVNLHKLNDLDLFGDIYETAHLIAALDLVIVPNTSIHSIANAVGTRSWLLSANVPLSPIPTTKKNFIASSPLFRTSKLFIKREHQDWSSTINYIAKQLEKFKPN